MSDIVVILQPSIKTDLDSDGCQVLNTITFKDCYAELKSGNFVFIKSIFNKNELKALFLLNNISGYYVK